MAKKQLMARVPIPTAEWLDRMISKGFFASYSHALNLGLKILRKSFSTTIKFKKANSRKTEEMKENDRQRS